jgi:hypothetical protein
MCNMTRGFHSTLPYSLADSFAEAKTLMGGSFLMNLQRKTANALTSTSPAIFGDRPQRESAALLVPRRWFELAGRD